MDKNPFEEVDVSVSNVPTSTIARLTCDSVLYFVDRHTTRSESQTHYQVLTIDAGRLYDITSYVARSLNYPMHNRLLVWRHVADRTPTLPGHQIVTELSQKLFNGRCRMVWRLL